jgi:DNA mismatch repair protein MutL
MSGYVAHPSHSRSNARTQYLFINGRAVRDRSLQHALAEAYRGLLLTGRHPIAFLNWTMPPELVDVNVHPTKLEVRFQDGGRLYSQLLATLRTRFLSVDLTHTWRPTGDEIPRSPAAESDEDRRLRQQVVDWAQKQVAPWFPTASAGNPSDSTATVGSLTGALRKPLELTRLDRSWPAVDRGEGRTGAAGVEEDRAKVDAPESLQPASSSLAADSSELAARPRPAVQIHNRYLVTESPHGVLVIDQHALHERILYEQLKANASAGSIERQRLLVPEPVDLTQAEAAAVLEHREVLAELGLEVEPFGGTTVLVTSVPAMLRAANGTELLRELVDIVSGGNRAPNERDLFDSLLHSMACKAAIKAGDPLSGEEIEALLAQRHLAQDSHHCPHGRPTALELTREQLDRQFLRT